MARCWWLAFLVWLPMVVAEGARAVSGLPVDPTVFDLSVHVRLLFALPMLLSSELLLEQTARSAIASFDRGAFCDRAQLARITARAERLRDAWGVELALLGIAIVGGQLVLWSVFGPTGLFHGGGPARTWTFAREWFALVALPLFQFVMFRWMWRWAIWTYVLARIARQPLSLIATHADYAAGSAPLARPVTAFSGFVLALSAILSAAWGTQVLEQRTTLQALLPMLGVFLLTALVVAVGPLLLLCGHLFRTRRATLARYGDFVRLYTVRFHQKWIEPTPLQLDDPLGSPDIQSLNDLGSAFQVASKTRVFVFGPRTVFTVWFAGLLPMVPLFMSTLTIEDVLKRIVATVMGGLPF